MKIKNTDKLVLSMPILAILAYSLPFVISGNIPNMERILVTFILGGYFWVGVYFLVKLIYLISIDLFSSLYKSSMIKTGKLKPPE